jgi:hypothetical protein
MRLRPIHCQEKSTPFRIASCQFLQQVMPLEIQLSPGDDEITVCSSATTDFLGRKMVVAVQCFLVNDAQVPGDRTNRGYLLLKPKQLRVMYVPFCRSPEHCLGKKSFPPQGHQPAGIEVFRMQAPYALSLYSTPCASVRRRWPQE